MWDSPLLLCHVIAFGTGFSEDTHWPEPDPSEPGAGVQELCERFEHHSAVAVCAFCTKGGWHKPQTTTPTRNRGLLTSKCRPLHHELLMGCSLGVSGNPRTEGTHGHLVESVCQIQTN